MEITGKLEQRMQTEQGQGSRGPWIKQSFVIETLDQYPRKVCLSLFGDEKVSQLTSFTEGDMIRVSFNIESREYNGRWYTDLRAYRVDSNSSAPANYATQAAPPMQQTTPVAPVVAPEMPAAPDAGDDLPF